MIDFRDLFVAALAKVDNDQKYLDENLDRLCEASAKQMLEEALGEVKRRVLGRTTSR